VSLYPYPFFSEKASSGKHLSDISKSVTYQKWFFARRVKGIIKEL